MQQTSDPKPQRPSSDNEWRKGDGDTQKFKRLVTRVQQVMKQKRKDR